MSSVTTVRLLIVITSNYIPFETAHKRWQSPQILYLDEENVKILYQQDFE